MKSFESHIIVSNMKYMSAQSDTMSYGAHTEQYLHFVLDISDCLARGQNLSAYVTSHIQTF